MRKFLIVLDIFLAVVLLLYVAKIFWLPEHADTDNNINGQLKVHYIDVGQGDSCFIELPNNETMLIDSGESKYGMTVSNFISSLGYSTIDYMVATHADSDHIGGLYKIYENFKVESCYTSPVKSETKTYERFCRSAEDEGIEIQTPSSNDYILDTSNLDIKVLGPFENKEYKDTNDASVVLLISYFQYDFLFTGDSSYGELEEYDIGDIEVLKVSHHGSYTGTSRKLIKEIKPEYSIISAGKNNKYGHPHEEPLEILSNSKIYCTIDCGTISAICSENSLSFSTEK